MPPRIRSPHQERFVREMHPLVCRLSLRKEGLLAHDLQRKGTNRMRARVGPHHCKRIRLEHTVPVRGRFHEERLARYVLNVKTRVESVCMAVDRIIEYSSSSHTQQGWLRGRERFQSTRQNRASAGDRTVRGSPLLT